MLFIFNHNIDTEYESVVKYWYENGLVTKTEDVTNNTITIYQYDQYGNVLKTTTEVTKDGETTVSISESTYDILGRVVSTKSGDSETVYTYDAAGRTLLINGDGLNHRTVYDNYGRTVQEIEDADYNPDLDNLPNAYGDTTVGQRYIYDSTGNLVKEINRFDLETDYIYSDDGLLYTKHFDIYDYYYNNKGSIDYIDVDGNTIVDYEYKVTDSSKNKDLTSGQYINRIVYADGYIEEQKYDKSGIILAKYANGSEYYSIVSSDNNKLVYYDKEIDRYNNVSSTENQYSLSQKKVRNILDVFDYSSTAENDVTTINETHFKKSFEAVIDKDSTQYTSAAMSFDYSIKSDNNDNTVTENITTGEDSILSAVYTYDEENSTYQKSYGTDAYTFKTVYSEGNISEDEENHYTYDEYGELTETTGSYHSSYTYDDRGNMTSKTVDKVTTTFSYDSTVWKDQLTAVDDILLTYDANGNLLSYGDKQYKWNHGKRLESITDGENTYSYKYNSDGIRTSKTVNGKTTNFDILNGAILAQDDIYFQYNNGNLIGFVSKDIQYFYITNLSGDIVGITDSNGELIAEYSYDEWGKLLSITTAEEGNEEQQKIAELNPFRYRGYYYDNETGYYYLQSRYYDPEIGRFISADGFEYIKNDTQLSTNGYLYCINNPLKYSDSTGHDFNWDFVLKFIKSCFIIDYIFPGFRYTPKDIFAPIKKVTNWVSEAGKVMGVVISEIFTCLDLQEIASIFGIDFTFSGFEDYLQKKVDLYKIYFDNLIATAAKTFASNISGFISTVLGMIKNLSIETATAIKGLPYVTNIINAYSGRYITPVGSIFMALFDMTIGGAIDFGGMILDSMVSPIIGTIFSTVADELYNVDSLRSKAEFLAYNWYYLLFVDWRNI